ncbi:arginase family protein [Campylobacter gastrosuis]|uniref:Arginase family protein n=1 Tax=Campylobacter gastrosuis TaxID=2974576 RepID=A0ABT7HPS7_9BACT|nr:arginase family protein [Campylobacter gastrosuis]MDL0088670.1 arginase family protein [Campylobacter gastrosuis]
MSKNLRLLYPQWQGAYGIESFFDEKNLSADEIAKGYVLGCEILNFLAPKNNDIIAKVPVSSERSELKNGVNSQEIIKNQLKIAFEILNSHKPTKITTLGGECSVSVAPFSYLANIYKDEVAIVWIDAHPDLSEPNKTNYAGFHAMALAQILGYGEFNDELPTFVSPKDALIVGLRSFSPPEARATKERLNVASISCNSVNKSSDEVMAWLKERAKRKILVHFDLDALDPNELRIAVGADPNGLSISAVTKLIKEISQNYDIVGLTIAEPMPVQMIKLRKILNDIM